MKTKPKTKPKPQALTFPKDYDGAWAELLFNIFTDVSKKRIAILLKAVYDCDERFKFTYAHVGSEFMRVLREAHQYNNQGDYG